MRKPWLLSVLATVFFIFAGTANATTLWVNPVNLGPAPGSSCNSAGYATIQAGINAAMPGDTVNVCPGKYPENITINKANLTVTAIGGSSATLIMTPVVAAVVTFTAPNSGLFGFTLIPYGSVAKYDIGVNVAIGGVASAEIANNYVRGGRIGINLGCGSSSSTIYHNIVRGATEAGINIDTCEVAPFPGSTFNTVHHNAVCGGTYPYSIAGGQGSDFNTIHHNVAKWISMYGDGNIVHDNSAQLFNIVPGSPANVTFNNTVAAVCQ